MEPTLLDIGMLIQIAELIERHGFMLIYAIFGTIFNIYFVLAIVRGKLVPSNLYTKAVEEADRLQETMEKERQAYLEKLTEYFSNLKKGADEDGDDKSNNG